METQKPEKRTRVVPKLGFKVLCIPTVKAQPAGSEPFQLTVWKPNDTFTTSESAADMVVDEGEEGYDYFIVRIQKGPMRLSKVTKLE